MSISPILALRRAVRTVLIGDADLVAALGGAKIYDEAPSGVNKPYAIFDDAYARDWSSLNSAGDEQYFAIAIWSSERGLREALAIAARVIAILNKPLPALQEHRLINLVYVGQRAVRESDGRFARVDIRFRAVTEIL